MGFGRKEKDMKKTKEFNLGWKLLTVVSSLILVLALGIFAEPFSMTSNAQSQGKVVVRSANIRQEADANSTVLGSAAQGASVTINSQTTGTDGNVWYQVFVDADTLGYIRSDLVEVTEGTTSDTADNTATTAPTAEVTKVEPLSASVTGGESVRVRSDASIGSQIVARAKDGLAITVIGQANGSDGMIWYQVNFIADGSEVIGFIRSDYVALSGDLVPVTDATETPAVDETPVEPEVPQEPEVVKDWDTEYASEKWILIDNTTGDRWDINNIFQTVKDNQVVVEDAVAKTKTQTVIIILLVILVLAMGGFVTVLIFKIKDINDSAYFEEVEKETIRRRTADRPVGAEKKVMHTVGAEKRPAGARPVGAPTQGQRPAGARPAGAPTQGQRPAGARPAGAPTQGQRPAGARPAGAPAQGQRPAGTRPTGAKPTAPVQGGTRPASQKPQQNNNQNPGWKSKNFMAEDDDFEFEFLNWDGDDE